MFFWTILYYWKLIRLINSTGQLSTTAIVKWIQIFMNHNNFCLNSKCLFLNCIRDYFQTFFCHVCIGCLIFNIRRSDKKWPLFLCGKESKMDLYTWTYAGQDIERGRRKVIQIIFGVTRECIKYLTNIISNWIIIWYYHLFIVYGGNGAIFLVISKLCSL